MKKIYILLVLLPLAYIFYEWNSSGPWLTDFDQAMQESKKTGKPILLYFSGSDWCGICMKMKSEILEKESFKSYASEKLVLMMADFPRMKKNKLDDKIKKQNDGLAEKYNPSGGFPYTVLLNSEGKVLKDWKGYPNLTPEAFVQQIQSCNGLP